MFRIKKYIVTYKFQILVLGIKIFETINISRFIELKKKILFDILILK